MGTFTPPVADGNARANPWGTSAKDRLMRHYGAQTTGVTVWQNQDLTWEESQYPYNGRPDAPGLLQARRVYLGGHVHEINDTQLVELAGAGYFDRINIADVLIDGWKPEDTAKLTRWRISTPGDGALPKAPIINRDQQLVFQNSAGPMGTSGGQRDVWIHKDILYDNFEGEIYFDAPRYGEGAGADQYLQQMGVVLRHTTSAGEQRMVAINNNVFFVVPVLNIGVWKSALDGSTMGNRQTSLMDFTTLFNPHFPYELGYRLDDNVVRCRVRKPNTAWPPWVDTLNGHTHSTAVNLDTECGSPAEVASIPTPVGRGGAGIIANHLGQIPEGIIGRRCVFRNPDNPGMS